MKTAIAIGGGVGPAAGVKLHELIISNSKATSDREHLPVIHISDSPHISDRTKYLLENEGKNPGVAMANVAESAWLAAQNLGYERVVFGVPCNTFHAPQVWDIFSEIVASKTPNVQIIHMLEETVVMIKNNYPNAKKIGLMSTTGTRETQVYSDLLEEAGFTAVEVNPEVQKELHDSIYNKEWGIKATGLTPSKRARANFEKYTNMLMEFGAEVIILGCTEIPLVLSEQEFKSIPLVNPMEALARALIKKTSL